MRRSLYEETSSVKALGIIQGPTMLEGAFSHYQIRSFSIASYVRQGNRIGKMNTIIINTNLKVLSQQKLGLIPSTAVFEISIGFPRCWWQNKQWLAWSLHTLGPELAWMEQKHTAHSADTIIVKHSAAKEYNALFVHATVFFRHGK